MAKPQRTLTPERKKGVQAELLAAAWLVNQGFWVFSPQGQHGPIDLIAVSKSGKVHLFDVKSLVQRQGKYNRGQVKISYLTAFQRHAGVRLLFVDLKSGEVFYITHYRLPTDRRLRVARNYALPNV